MHSVRKCVDSARREVTARGTRGAQTTVSLGVHFRMENISPGQSWFLGSFRVSPHTPDFHTELWTTCGAAWSIVWILLWISLCTTPLMHVAAARRIGFDGSARLLLSTHPDRAPSRPSHVRLSPLAAAGVRRSVHVQLRRAPPFPCARRAVSCSRSSPVMAGSAATSARSSAGQRIREQRIDGVLGVCSCETGRLDPSGGDVLDLPRVPTPFGARPVLSIEV